MSESTPSSPNIDIDPTQVYRPSETASVLVRILDQYLADLQAGHAPDKAQLLADHPELAAQLEDCFAGIEFVHRAAKPVMGTPAQLGDFRIVREVGRGGMGVVFEAEQLSLKRTVALKVLRFGITADEQVMQRFQREAETVAHLHHTNIVPIHAIGCEDGVHYYAMQFIEGHSLAEEIGRHQSTDGAPDFKAATGWALQAAEALAYAHQRGVIHRDIKPSNLILDPEGTVWLTDFGLAKRADEVTMTAAGMVMGTPRYMSPEQAAAARQPIDHRTDIYSLGATLYELATGRPVFDSQTPQGVITQILHTEPVPPRVFQGHLPRDLETIILKCLVKDPSRRYQSARELADDLRALVENRPIRARRASFVEQAGRWLKKHRRSTIVAAVAAAASMLFLVVGLSSWNAYQESLLGRLTLTTDGPSLVADILDRNGDVIVPSVAVPTAQPVALRSGTYQMRLSNSGQLSETWDIIVPRGETVSLPVKMLDRMLGPPLELRGSDPPLRIELNGQAYWLVRGDRSWRLLDGATQSSVWLSDLTRFPEKPEDAQYPNTYVGGASQDLLQVDGTMAGQASGSAPGVMQPAADIDADGRDDLIFASRVSPSLVAVSGKTGQVLWWYRALPIFPDGYDQQSDPLEMKSSAEDANTIGEPVLTHINGEPAILAVFATHSSCLRTRGGKEFTAGRRFYIEAVRIRDGQQLWRTAINLPEFKETYIGNIVKAFAARPERISFGEKTAVVVSVNSTLFMLDEQTGTMFGTPYDAGATLLQAPIFTDLDGDQQAEAVLVHAVSQMGDHLRVRVIALATQTTLWERSFLTHANVQPDTHRAAGAELVRVLRLQDQSPPLLVVGTRDDWQTFSKHWLGVEALNALTGETQWQARLWDLGVFSGSGELGAVQVQSGPDLDRDGIAEVFAVSVSAHIRAPEPEMPYLQVDALSGRDGKVLSRRRHRVGAKVRDLRMTWWQSGSDGLPLLVVPVGNGQGGQPVTHVFEASTGKILHLLPEVADPQIADMNNDGIPDLYHVATTQGVRRLSVLKGMPPLDWRRTANPKAAGDYDGDGITDLIDISHGLTARSGVDGRPLWNVDVNIATQRPPLIVDLDGDDVTDCVIRENSSILDPRGYSTTHITVAAFSGKDGHRLWTGPSFGHTNAYTASSGSGPRGDYHYPMLDSVSFDPQESPVVLVAAHADQAGLCLTAVSGQDGKLLWRVPIVPAAYTGVSLIDRHLFADVNGDGVRDFVVWSPERLDSNGNQQGGFVLKAISGRDGATLWATGTGLISSNWFLWPRTALADLDGDGSIEVVLTGNDGRGFHSDKHGYSHELIVLEGRTGQLKWKWEWISPDFTVWPPLLVDADGNGRRVICMGISEPPKENSTKPRIVVFNADGTIRQSLPVDNIHQGDRSWMAADLHSEGFEHLIYRDQGDLVALDLRTLQRRWTWRARSSWGLSLDQLYRERSADHETLIAWRDQTAYGLNLTTGTPSWRCDVPSQDNYHIEAEFICSPQTGNLPQILTGRGGGVVTTAQTTWPTDHSGRYLSPSRTPFVAQGVQPSIRYRPLPWVQSMTRLNPMRFVNERPFKALLMFLEWPIALLYFATLIRFASGHRWTAVVLYLLATCVLAAATAVLSLWTNARWLAHDERYNWNGWYWILWGNGILTIGILTLIVHGLSWGIRVGSRMRVNRQPG